jgi:hypothetical protein
MNKDLNIIALSEMLIQTWNKYKSYEGALALEMEVKGFKQGDLYDAESFISDNIIGDEIKDGVEFEKEFQKELKRQKKQ